MVRKTASSSCCIATGTGMSWCAGLRAWKVRSLFVSEHLKPLRWPRSERAVSPGSHVYIEVSEQLFQTGAVAKMAFTDASLSPEQITTC